MSRCNRKGLFVPVALALGLIFGAPQVSGATNGTLTVLWDANTTDTDLNGYRVYLSTDATLFNLTPAAARPLATTRTVGTSTTTSVFTSLNTASTYYVAVTSYDTSGNESVFSNVASAQPAVTPTLTSVSPTSATQGDTGVTVTLNGTNFQSGAVVSFGPGLTVTALNTSAVPLRLVATVDVETTAPVDMRDVSVTNPGNGVATKTNGFQVLLDVARVDINQSNRIDGGDIIEVAAAFASRSGDASYSVDFDLNVDGAVDGVDLSFLVTYFGSVGPF
ncbi:MAG TPA: dockerin type I domain-containing protein [Candidatus Polarisedimenticolia bacterium]|jgi:hypothetical protein